MDKPKRTWIGQELPPSPNKSLEESLIAKLASYKDAIPALLGGLALVYALGWVIRAITVANLGLGIVEASHQTITVTGLGFVVYIGSAALVALWIATLLARWNLTRSRWSFSERDFRTRDRILIIATLLSVLTAIMFFASGPQASEVRALSSWLMLLCAAFTFMFLKKITAYSLEWAEYHERRGVLNADTTRRIDSEVRIKGSILVMVLSLGTVFAYSDYVLPTLPPCFGGGGRDAWVHVTLKDPEGEFDGRVIEGDSQSVIFLVVGWEVRPKQILSGPTAIRFPTSQIASVSVLDFSSLSMKELEQIYQGSKPGPRPK